MKTPHKHAELIKAWADGAEIEFFDTRFDEHKWKRCSDSPMWDRIDVEFRIKPKPDHVYYGVFEMNGSMHLESCFTKINDDGDHIKLTFDGETGKLKSAEVL